MPWRLIIAIVIFAVFLVFAAFNADNKCNIEFGFGLVIENVPVFITIFTSFVIGLVCSVPLILHVRHKYRKMLASDRKPANGTLDEGIQYDDAPSVASAEVNAQIKNDAAEAKKRFLSKRRGGGND